MTNSDQMNTAQDSRATPLGGPDVGRRALFAASFLTAENQLDFATSFLDRTAHAAPFVESRLVAGDRGEVFGESFLDRSR